MSHLQCIKLQGAVQGSEALVVPNTRSYATGIWQGELPGPDTARCRENLALKKTFLFTFLVTKK